jgi:hypothetical protein
LNKYFKIGLVHADEVEEIDLVKGSHHIPDSLYQCPKTFGKKDRSPKVTLGTSKLEIWQMVSEVLGGSGVVSRFETMIGTHTPCDGAMFRFIKLSKQRTMKLNRPSYPHQHTPIQSRRVAPSWGIYGSS